MDGWLPGWLAGRPLIASSDDTNHSSAALGADVGGHHGGQLLLLVWLVAGAVGPRGAARWCAAPGRPHFESQPAAVDACAAGNPAAAVECFHAARGSFGSLLLFRGI